jgi:hypothetical protein
MGSGVFPLAMATRPAKTAESPGEPPLLDLARAAGRTASPSPDLIRGSDPGTSCPMKRVVRVSSGGKARALPEEGCRPMGPRVWIPGSQVRGRGHCSPNRSQVRAGALNDFCRWVRTLEADRAISTGQLRGLPRFHLRPIDVMVCDGSRRDLVLRRVSRLDAFSGYPGRT